MILRHFKAFGLIGLHPVYPVLLSIVLLFLLCLYPPTLSAQQKSESPPGAGSLKASEYDQNQLKKLSPEELDALDGKLSEALILYYDGKYGQALRMFSAVASEIETMDVMWWIGASAMRTGDLKRAAEEFQKLLAVDPNLARVRLELAATYFQMGRFGEAGKELEIVKSSNPPQGVLENIARLLAAIDEATKKLYVGLRFSQGIQWDTNISSGPDKRELNVTGGTLTISQESQKLRDWASVTNVQAGVLYDIGEKQGLMWNTTAELYKSVYFSHSQFNYMLTDVTTGPWWAGKQDIVKIPFGFADQEYGSDRLSYIVHTEPSYEHFFNPYLSLRGTVGLSKETFYDEAKNGALDNATRRYEISPTVYLSNRKHIFSIAAGYEESDAEQRRFTYTAKYYALTYLTRFPTRTEFLARYQWAEKDYKDAPLLYSDDRIDRRHTISAVLNQDIYKGLFASFAFNYIDNKSNADLFTFDKTTYTLSLGWFF